MPIIGSIQRGIDQRARKIAHSRIALRRRLGRKIKSLRRWIIQRHGQWTSTYRRKSSNVPSAFFFGRVQSSLPRRLQWCTVTWEYSQKNDGQPPENVQNRANQRLRNVEVKIRRCEWLWKLTPTFIPVIQPRMHAEAMTKAARDHGPVMPASLGCRYSQNAHAKATRHAAWKITQCRS